MTAQEISSSVIFSSHFWTGCTTSWRGGSLLMRVKYCRWPTFFIPNILMKKIRTIPKSWPNYIYGIDPDVVVNHFILFSKSREIKVWKEKYEEFLKMKEKANNDPLTKAPETWLCLPTLLKVFGENSITNQYPDHFEVVKIVATLPGTVASSERAHKQSEDNKQLPSSVDVRWTSWKFASYQHRKRHCR